MGDKTSLQKLGDEFCTAVRAKTQSKHTDIEERLDSLLKLIKQKKDPTTITTELDRIEKALRDKNEYNPRIRECEKKIREFWDLKGKKTGTVEKEKKDPKKQGHGSGKTDSKQLRSLQSDTDRNISGKAMAQTQETGNRNEVPTKTTSYGNQSQHQEYSQPNAFQERAQTDIIPEMTDEEEQRLKHLGEHETPRTNQIIHFIYQHGAQVLTSVKLVSLSA